MTTPMFRQYLEVKKKLSGEILFFRMGDFYEMFYEDAKIASRVLGIALTSRSNGKEKVPMAGVPYQSASSYLKKLIQAGYKVAICDQVEDPKQAKGLVRRELVRIVTPGTLIEEDLLEEKRSNYLLALSFGKREVGLAWVDISTGEFFLSQGDRQNLLDQLDRIRPSECVVPEKVFRQRGEVLSKIQKVFPRVVLTPLEDWFFDEKEGVRRLKKLYRVVSLRGMGIEGKEIYLAAAAALLEYLERTQQGKVGLLQPVSVERQEDYMYLDIATQRTLELLDTMGSGGEKYTLLSTLDRTRTPMGGRLLVKWIVQPLRKREAILERLEGVEELVEQRELRHSLTQALEKVQDLERMASRVQTGSITPRGLAHLRSSLATLPEVKHLLASCSAKILKKLWEKLDALEDLKNLLERALSDWPPLYVQEGGVIREGYSKELDELRFLSQDADQWMEEYQKREAERLGIPSLKVGFNQVFGYYIEVTNPHRHKVPKNYIRRQTLKNAERYITPELKEFEEKVLDAKEKMLALEAELFQKLKEEVRKYVPSLIQTARAIAVLDVLLSFAQVAVERGYVKPEIVEEFVLEIEEGRHPVLERVLEAPFVPNDTYMGRNNYLHIITGPNMAGKSTYIRQVGLIVLLAQMGSFVSAKRARIGLVDRLFTRLGSTDELYLGYSTFMVEMLETANILNHATERSLVLLDEVGRGTSTYDGVSIAWAICEYLHDVIRCRTLFATHYHELTELPKKLQRAANYNIEIREWEGEIVFLHKIQKGPTTKSYGVHVAKLAGMPKQVLARAEEILAQLEKKHRKNSSKLSQLFLFAPPSDSQLREKLLQIPLDHITPLEALLKLKELQELAKREG